MTTKEFAKILQDKLTSEYGVDLSVASHQQIYRALALICRQMMSENHKKFQSKAIGTGSKQVYYLCMEFLMGRSLKMSLFNLGLNDAAQKALAEADISLDSIYEEEPDAGLGNGGLGRLAACFLDSIAALGLPGDGVGLNYHFGLFRQVFSRCKQTEEPDPWLQSDGWLIQTGRSFPVSLGDTQVTAVMYDIAIPGAGSGCANRLHLFDLADPAHAPWVGIDFDKGDIGHNLTSFLYPDDSDQAGWLLRVYQQYFLVSAGAQLILAELEERGFAPDTLADHVVIQINDTHPSMVIPELVRLLMERGLTFDQAADQVTAACAYTNHTILAEALEKWPASYLEQVTPQLLPFIRALDERARKRSDAPELAIWDAHDVIHMAHMDIHSSAKVNGVAELHTEILKNTELHSFYVLYPEKFNNKTNGITFRRWLMGCNPALSDLITQAIGPEWKRDAGKLEGLMDHMEDSAFREQLLSVKGENKTKLARWLKGRGTEINPDSILDIQIKRLHQYKRQQMNALYAIWKYLQIKEGRTPTRPVTMVFGAKAAPAYTLAKDTIHLLLCLSRLIDQDPQVSPWLKLVMVENYNVSSAELLVPACDVSEQISLASKEASGTGNMKLMANGAVTLGTLDGANVEISRLVGEENIYIFGRSADEVIDLYQNNAYRSSDYWQKPEVERLVDFIISPQLLTMGDAQSLSRLYKDFISKDYFMALLDLEDYIAVKERCLTDYEDRDAWSRKMLVNIARSGFFSSDRTIAEYDQDIWHLK